MAITFTSRSGGRLSEILALEREEDNNHDKIRCMSVSSSMLLPLAMFLESFRWCFDTSSGTEGPSLVKLQVEESVVKG